MTDKELLKTAAKAIGHQARFSAYGSCDIDEGEYWVRWNPLMDDGDALRLAVKLVITLVPYPDCAATRRAITVAAAEIGKGMP